MFNKMLDGISTRPVIYVVPIVVISVLLFYFSNLKERCIYQASLRTEFELVVQNGEQGSIIRLAEILPFSWEKVKIFSKFRPLRESRTCPFGWDWSSDERDSIISSDRLTVLIFAKKGKLSNYIELRSDRVNFNVSEESLLPEEALFIIEKDKTNTTNRTNTLILAP